MEMKINGIDARLLGIRMGNGFLDVLAAPLPMKEYIENKSRLEHGKQVLYNNPKLADREVTLPFVVMGEDEREFLKNLKFFAEILYKGKVEIYVPATGETYRFTYERSQNYAQNQSRTACTVAVKFNEPDPSDRND